MKDARKIVVIAVIFAVLFSSYSLIRTEAWHKLHGDYGYDLEIFSESLESTLHGRGFFFNTREWEDLEAWSHFGVHNSPVLFLLLPVYAIYPDVHTLLVVQAFSIAFASIILFKLAQKVLNNERTALMVSTSYLLNPLTHGIVRYEFHAAVLGIPFMFLFAYYMANENFRKALVAALLVLSVKEDAGLFLIAYSVFEILRKHGFNTKSWLMEKNAIGFAILGASWMLFSVFVVIPHFNTSGSYPYLALYGAPNKVILMFSLIKLFAAFFSVAFIPIEPKYSIPIVILWLENSSSHRISQACIGFQYDYMMLAMLFIVLIYALKREPEKSRLIVPAAMISALLFSPILAVVTINLWGLPLVVYDRFWTVLEIFLRG